MEDTADGEGRNDPFSTGQDTGLQEYIPHPYQILNGDGGIVAVNDAWVDFLGRERESVMGDRFAEFLTDESRVRFEETFETLRDEGDVSDVELEISRPDGSTVFVALDCTVECEDAGDFDRAHCQFTDITEQIRYKTFVQNSPDIVLLHDESGDAKYVSPAVEREMGHDPEALIGRTPFTDIHPEDRERAMEAFNRILTNPGEVMTEEFRIKGGDGSFIWVESRGRNLQEVEGIDGILLNSRVIDERKAYETEIERQNERLNQFASIVSHDLRNPLNVAQGRIDLAREECESEHLDTAASAVERSLELIEDMLALARLGNRVREKEPVDMGAIAKASWANVETSAAELVVEDEWTIEADQSRIRQLFENLFRNAVEHAGEEVTVTVGSLSDGFYVEDDGPGIPEDERDDVLKAGYSGVEDGSGFGLSIVKEIADAHEWSMEISTGSEGGARFEFTDIQVSPEH